VTYNTDMKLFEMFKKLEIKVKSRMIRKMHARALAEFATMVKFVDVKLPFSRR